jgi:Fe2+ or Zn2+ uptake regulation protein
MPTSFDHRLHEAGLRVTTGRLALLAALEDSPHSDATTLHRLLAQADATTSIQSVHNVLGDLTAAGLLRRIEPANSAARYELRVDDNHHHIVCTSCGAVADVECAVGHAPCLTPSNTAGFAVATAEVTFWGVCAPCQIDQLHKTTKEIHD